MLLIHCPYCQEDRPEIEFVHAGEAHIARPADMASLDDEQLERYLFLRTNPRGMHRERWRHVHGCGRFFNALRHTVSDRFSATYPAGAPQPATPAGEETR